MSSSRLRLRRASFSLNLPKHDVYKSTTGLHGLHGISSLASNLTPDIQSPTAKPLLVDPATVGANVVRIGSYLVCGDVKSSTGSQGSSSHRDAVNVITEEQFTCKVVCYHKCIKVFFGCSKYHSVTAVLFDLKLPSFNTIMHNFRHVYSAHWWSSGNMLVINLRIIGIVPMLSLIHI